MKKLGSDMVILRALEIRKPPPPAIADLEAERNIQAAPAANLG
jgi:hypothetical protein